MKRKLITPLNLLNNFIILNLLSLGVVFASTSSFEDHWTPLYEGIDYKLVVKKSGRLRIHQIKIATDNSALDVFVTPPLQNKNKTSATKASTFLKREKAQIVINGAGYYPANLSPEGALKRPESISISQGIRYAEAGQENAAFIVLHDGSKKIIKSEEFSMYEGFISMALGAWPWAGVQGLLIEDGKSCVPSELLHDEPHARSALGISKDGKSLYLVVIEGTPRNESIFKDLVSEGVYLKDLAKIMLDLDCDRAMNLDGGGSSTLVVENIINNKPLILNTPSDHKGERALGSHLGIRAPHLSKKTKLLKTFRALQEESCFFDLLRKSVPALTELYMDDVTSEHLDPEDVSSIDQLYEHFGIESYLDFNIDYNLLLNAKGKSLEECFTKNDKYEFDCGDPKVFLDEMGFKKSESIMKLSDLTFVGKKQTGVTSGGTYRDNNKVFYFVKKAQFVENELIGSRLINLILGTERTPIVKLLEDRPGMVASRMIRGFGMAVDVDKKKEIIGKVELNLAMDFIGLVDRHARNMGFVELDAGTAGAARVDFDYSFLFSKSPDFTMQEQDPLSLKLLYQTLEKYSVNDIIPVLESIIAIPDQQFFMVVFRSWIELSQTGNSFSLEDAFNLASSLINRKVAFKKALFEINELKNRKNKDKTKKTFVRNSDAYYENGNSFRLKEIEGTADKISLWINNVQAAEFSINNEMLKGAFEYSNKEANGVIRLAKIKIDGVNFVYIDNLNSPETETLNETEKIVSNGNTMNITST